MEPAAGGARSEQLVQPGVAGAAHRRFGSVLEDGDVTLPGGPLQPRQPIEVENGRAVDAHEPFRIQLAFEFRQRLLLQQLPAADHETDVVVPGQDVVDAPCRNDFHLGARADQDAVATSARRARAGRHPGDRGPLGAGDPAPRLV